MSTMTATVDLPSVPRSVPAARHLVVETLRAWGARQDRDDAALLVTELVANVVDHAPGEVGLTLELAMSDGWLRIGVIDGSVARPVVRRTRREPRGRGLLLVQRIADRWGSEDHRDGKRVWFELRPPGL